MEDQNPSKEETSIWKPLEAVLKQHVINQIGAPVTGRISEIVPFFPFNDDEQAVATYKFMRQLWKKVRAPVDTDARFFPGHAYINYVDDGRIATHLAKEGYLLDLGARSLHNAVVNSVQQKVAEAFFKQQDEINDDVNIGPLPQYIVRLVTSGKDSNEIVVECKGTREIQERVEELSGAIDTVVKTPPSPTVSDS